MATRTGSQDGIKCPPLKAEVECGKQPCPQDGEVSPWASWTACSAACNGGTQSRSRSVIQSPRYGGMDSPHEEERRICNGGACNKDCVLSDWSPWHSCSRACRFEKETPLGRRQRTRGVARQPTGRSTCPDELGPQRLQEEPCNDYFCHENSTCKSSQQVFVLLDGSDAANFQAQLQMLQGIVERSAEGMHFGVAAYGQRVKMLSPVTADHAALLAALAAAKLPGGSPDLAQAEAYALNLIRASSMGGGATIGTILILADASLAVLQPAVATAQQLRDLGVRLLFGVVEDGFQATKLGASRLAGVPCDSKFVSTLETARNWEELTASPMRFLAALCDNLLGPPLLPPSGSEALEAR